MNRPRGQRREIVSLEVVGKWLLTFIVQRMAIFANKATSSR
jgi:hypothetical protein